MTDGNLQQNPTERKFPFRSVTLCRLHSVPFRRKMQLGIQASSLLQLPRNFNCCVFSQCSIVRARANEGSPSNWNSANFQTFIEKPPRKRSPVLKSPVKNAKERSNNQSIGFRIYEDNVLYNAGTGHTLPRKTYPSQVWRPPAEAGHENAVLHEQLIASGKAVPARQMEYQTLYGVDQGAMHRSKKGKSKNLMVLVVFPLDRRILGSDFKPNSFFLGVKHLDRYILCLDS
uniref:Uncharacterized protein n=1 Tax=Romanomermis culicivorax TaxID=13658 RepID=A0A915J4F8_ROMCU